MLNILRWRISTGTKQAINSLIKVAVLKMRLEQPLSKVGLTLEEELTHENWLRVVYKSVIDSKGKALTSEQMRKLKKTLTPLLPTVSTLEEELKILEMFLALRYSEASFSLVGWLKESGISEGRYRAVLDQLLSVEVGYFQALLNDSIIEVKVLRKQIKWIQRLLEGSVEQGGSSDYEGYKDTLLDWIYQLVSLFLQQLQQILGESDRSYLLTHYGKDYRLFADDVYKLVSRFHKGQEVLYESLERWYQEGASCYEGLELACTTLPMGDQLSFSFTHHGEVRPDFKERWKKELAKIEAVCKKDYKNLREWARFASRSVFMHFLLNEHEGLLSYKSFYKQLLEKQRLLQEGLWSFRSKAEERLRDLPEAGAADDYLTALDLLDKQLIAFNKRLTDASDEGILGACFELTHYAGTPPLMDKVQRFLTALTTFITTHEPLLDWLRHSCYCAANTEGAISYEMNQRIQKAGGANASLDYKNLTTTDSMTDYVLRQLSHLLEDKTVLVKLHPDKNQALNKLGKYGGRFAMDLRKDVFAFTQSWLCSQWGADTLKDTPQSTALVTLDSPEEKDSPEENELLPVIQEPTHGISIGVLALKEQYIERIKAGDPLTKHTRAAALIPPACCLYEGRSNKSERELWEISTAVRQIWNEEARKLSQKIIKIEKIIEEARAGEAQALAKAAELQTEIDAGRAGEAQALAKAERLDWVIKNTANRLLSKALLAVQSQKKSTDKEEVFLSVIDFIYSEPAYEISLKMLIEVGWTRESFRGPFEALLVQENELSKGKEDEIDLLTDGLITLSVSSSGEGLLEQEDKPNKKQEEATASPQEESLSPKEAKRRSKSFGWQFFRGEVVQLTETTGLIASPGLSSAGSDTE